MDSARKFIDCAEKLGLPGWGKSADWRRRLKGLMRAVGKAHRGGGRGRAGRIREAAKAYLKKAKALEKKRTTISEVHSGREKEQWDQLGYYEKMRIKHIDLVKRRLVKGEKILHKEKVFSIFQPWTELIKNPERRPPVEFCPNRNQSGFDRYIGLAAVAYNLHKIGRELLPTRRVAIQQGKAA